MKRRAGIPILPATVLALALLPGWGGAPEAPAPEAPAAALSVAIDLHVHLLSQRLVVEFEAEEWEALFHNRIPGFAPTPGANASKASVEDSR